MHVTIKCDCNDLRTEPKIYDYSFEKLLNIYIYSCVLIARCIYYTRNPPVILSNIIRSERNNNDTRVYFIISLNFCRCETRVKNNSVECFGRETFAKNIVL